jgi:hypothetical protein
VPLFHFSEDPHQQDAGMFVSAESVTPVSVQAVGDLGVALERADVELRVMRTLLPLRDLWSTTLHASGVLLRNAQGWEGRTATGSPPRPPVHRRR